ncbi:MAG: hypothetical protein M1827_003565 [Pycnora praestabilis]|nr:MAG: hypothetical protein M1827_003565 [Pycnora praestabilis]
MAAFSRGFLRQDLSIRSLSRPPYREIASSAVLMSGHNRWSKIKHDKGKEDAAKNRQRSVMAQEIMLASKSFGADPNTNPRLAGAIASAKKAGFPKTSIEAAVSRGQGVSPSGTALESLTIEAILPPSVALVIECQTDSKARTLADLRQTIKYYGGTVTPTSYLFEKKGMVVFERAEGVGVDEVLEEAVEEGAIDVQEDKEGRVIVYTEPGKTASTAESLALSKGLKVETSEIVWDPNEDTKVNINSAPAMEALDGCLGMPTSFKALRFVTHSILEEIHENSSVQGVYLNVA